jgi:2-keto-4-pentenoate hydratase/2-oxohepta-3-ene-1,7-dioic acid hydratase in catechol pathway
MRIYRFRYRKKILHGILKEEFLFPLKGSIFRDFKIGDSPIPMGEVKLLPPVEPSKIIGIGRNYREHAKELGNPLPEEPLIFLKPSTAVIGPGETIFYPDMSARVDYEGELAVVIRKKARLLKDEEPVADYILGYTCFNDVTARDLQTKDVQFTRAKSFDTFAAVGPCIATDIDPGALHLKTFLNGKLVQSGATSSLIFPVPFLVRFVSRVMTLLPGDIISTGTPAGVGPMVPGDRVDVQIEGIGVLSNKLARAKQEKEEA